MPELPEVETISRQLKKEILNKEINEVIIKDKRLIKEISPQKFKGQTEGGLIKDIVRRGKVLIVQLDKRPFLIIHLRISGWLILSREIEKFARVIFKLSDGKLLNFCDARALGEIRLIDDWQELPIVKSMGPEPLELKKSNFVNLFEGKKVKIKSLLMDQSFLAGVGNIYAQESLFCAKIHPAKPANKVTKSNLEKLYECLKAILKEAVSGGGSSVDTYKQIDGKAGGYVPLLKVYQREGKACVRCKTSIKREIIAGRGTYFCPRCQK